FFADGAAAHAAGLRPCKRCRPDEVARDEAAVLAAIDEIKASEGRPQLAELAEAVGYSPAHVQRVFTRATGLSPSAYARAPRAARGAGARGGEGRKLGGRADVLRGLRGRLAVLRFEGRKTGHGTIRLGQRRQGRDDPLGGGGEQPRPDARCRHGQGRLPRLL